MRGLRSTLLLLVVAVGLGAYIYFVERHRDPASEDGANEQAFTFEADEVSELAVTQSDGTTTRVRRDGEDWEVVAPIATAADDTTVSSIASSLASLEIRRVVVSGEDGPVDLEPFGLDSPSLDISFTTTDAEPRHLLIGDQTPTGSDRYAKLSDRDRVFLIASHLNGTFDKSTFDLRDKTILAFERADLDGLTITSADSTIHLRKNDDDWQLSEPWGVQADFGTVESLVGSLGSGRMQSVDAETAEELELYGLVDPALTVAVSAGSATARLHIGDEAPSGGRYARDESRSIVFTVDNSLVTSLERDAGEYRRKDLFGFRSFNATRLEVDRVDGTIVIEKTDAESEDDEEPWRQVAPDSAELDQDKVQDLLRQLSGLRAESFIGSRAEAGLDDEQVVATVRARYGDDDTEETVVVWRVEEETWAVPEGEPGAARIDSQTFDSAIETLDQLRAEE